jgi:AAA-like domain
MVTSDSRQAEPDSGFYFAGGTLPPDHLSYVERQADRDLLQALCQGEYCYVLNSRQMGKSSLCVRAITHLRAEGVRTAFLDLTKFGGRNLTAEQWYAAILAELGRELDLRAECIQYWKEHPELPPVQRLFGAMREVALPSRDDRPPTTDHRPPAEDPTGTQSVRTVPSAVVGGRSSVVIFVDEIDITRSLPFNTDEFFAAIRQCYVGRATDPVLKQATFCLLGTATPAELIEDTRISPFNIGRRIEVRDFTAEEAAPLARGLVHHQGTKTQSPDGINKDTQDGQDGEREGRRLLDRILYWTGGHPYLTQRLCRAVAEAGSLALSLSRSSGRGPSLRLPLPDAHRAGGGRQPGVGAQPPAEERGRHGGAAGAVR